MKAFLYQTRSLLFSWKTLAVWLILNVICSANFVSNCISNSRMHYITEMFDPIKMLTISSWSNMGTILMYVYPFILTIPTAMFFYEERTNKVSIYIQGRFGFKAYYYGSALAVFITTFFLFSLPFLLELVLSQICFSSSSVADPSNFQYFVTLSEIKHIYMYKIFLFSPELYGMVMIFRFGFISAILALFNYSFAISPRIKFKMMTLVPIVAILYVPMIVERFLPVTFSYMRIVPIFESVDLNNPVYFGAVFAILGIAIIGLWINEKKYYSFK